MLDALFKPRSVAVVGASTKELSIGNAIIANLQAYGYKGEIYPINPNAPEVRGIQAYAKLSDVQGNIDLAHIVVPSAQVPQAVEECGQKGIKAVIINTAGFKEAGEEGERLQDEFLAAARRHGIRVFGPNCQGIINTDPSLRAYCNFTNTMPPSGGISVAALSGGVGALIMQGLSDIGIGLRMYASNGNASDISMPEIIRYWGDDPETRAIIVYTEGFADPKAFLDAAQAVTPHKPVLAMRAGRTSQGAKAAASHTGALAGAGKAIDLLFEKAGVLAFTDEGEMIRAAQALATQPAPRGNRVGIITNTGGPAVIATDILVDAGLDVPTLSTVSQGRLQAGLLPQAAVSNPIDVVATASPEHFLLAIDTLLDDDGIDSVFINFVTPSFSDTRGIARAIVSASQKKLKPIICNFMTDIAQERFQETGRILSDGGVPCYAYPSDAAKVLGALNAYSAILRSEDNLVEHSWEGDRARAKSIIARISESARHTLSAEEVYEIFECYGIPVAPWAVVGDAQSAVIAASKIGYPVVIKVDCEAIEHKSDLGGVAVNLNSDAEVSATVEAMTQKLGSYGTLRFLVQKFVQGGQELIVGAASEGDLGHMVMFGLGGIYVEVLKDVSFKLAPVTIRDARSLLSSIKAAAILDGVRGKPGIDKDATVDVITRLSCLLTDLPMIAELDINPLLAFQHGTIAVDGRIRINPTS